MIYFIGKIRFWISFVSRGKYLILKIRHNNREKYVLLYYY